jgi:hypothetical protein
VTGLNIRDAIHFVTGGAHGSMKVGFLEEASFDSGFERCKEFQGLGGK